MALERRCQLKVSVNSRSHLPIGAVQGHIGLDDTIDTNPLILRGIALEGNVSMPADKAATTICADQVFAARPISKTACSI